MPWSKIAANPRQFVSEECWPDELLKYLKDPSGVVVEGCMELLLFWRARQARIDVDSEEGGTNEDGQDKQDSTTVFEWPHWIPSRGKMQTSNHTNPGGR